MIIEIPLQEIIPQDILQALSPEIVRFVVVEIGASARAQWIRYAQEQLKGSRNDYVNSIQKMTVREGMAIISLVGQPANLIEHGSNETDLRDTLLGPNVPVAPMGKKGKRRAEDGNFYRAIPFRHSTPGSKGSTGAPMGNPYADVVEKSAALGRNIYKEAKKLMPSTSDGGSGRMKYGGRLSSGRAPKLKAHHKTDIYAGMIRSQKTYKRATQSQYTTFRTISTRNKEGWIRSQTEGILLSEKVNEFVAQIAPQAFEAYVKGIGKK